MAEAVGLAASIVGLITIASKVTKLCSYFSEATNAREDIKQLISEISSLADLLEPLSAPAEASRISQSPDSDSMSQWVLQFTEILEQLQGELQAQVKKSDSKTRNLVGSLKASLKWPFKKEDTRDRIQKIERLKTALSLKLQLDERQRGKYQEQQQRDHEQRQEQRQREQEQREEQRQRDQEQRQKDQEQRQRDQKQEEKVEQILEWISSERSGKRHAELQSNRMQGIGNWLLATPEFAKWKTEDPCTVLLGRGIAGAGKTYLSSVVIDHLNEQRHLNGFGVGHVYFEYQEQKQQTVLAVVASLVKQLLSQISPTEFPKEIEVKYQEKKTQHVSADDLTDMLLSMPKRFARRVFVVCDALDEMDQQEQREKLLPLFHHMRDSGIALFLTTRPHPADIQDSFHDAPTIELAPKDHDIRQYVEGRLSANARFQRIQQGSSGLRNQTVSKILDSAAGIFLLAKFNADHIVRFLTAGRIKQALSDLSIPETTTGTGNSERENERHMDKFYDRIINSIRAQPRDIQKYAFRALSWIGYATRTLTVREVLVAISVEGRQYQLNDSDMFGLEDLLDICGGLVIADGQAVRLVHFSVRNYLDRHQVIPGDTREAYRAIACSTYLSFDTLKERHRIYSSQSLEVLNQSLPFLDYSANNLAFHLSKVEPKEYPDTTSAVMELLEDKGHRRAYSIARDGIPWPLDIPRLNLVCAIGYEDAVRTLLEEGEEDFNAKDLSVGLTPLSWAVLMGHEAVVKRLLDDDGVDRDCKHSSGKTPLSLAVSNRKPEIVRLLLEKGVEVDYSYEEVVLEKYLRDIGLRQHLILLRYQQEDQDFLRFHLRLEELVEEKSKSFLEYQERRGKIEQVVSPLLAAVRSQCEPIVRLLLEKGAKPDLTLEFGSYAGESPLSFAEKSGLKDIVKLLRSYVQQE